MKSVSSEADFCYKSIRNQDLLILKNRHITKLKTEDYDEWE